MASRNLSITKDAHVKADGTGWQGSETTLLTGHLLFASPWRAFLQFAMDWTDVETLTSAQLHIRASDIAGSSIQVQINRVTETWLEASGDTPAVTSSGEVSYSISSTGWKSYDITAIVTAWLPGSLGGGGQSPYGIRLRMVDEDDAVSWYSRESAYDAYITINYTTNVVPDAPNTLKVNDLTTGNTIDGSTDPVFKATHHDDDGDPIDEYNIRVVATTANGVQPADWAAFAIYSADVTAPDASIVGNNITKTGTGAAAVWTRGTWYCMRVRTNDGVSGWGPYSYLWFRVNSLPTVSLSEPSATGRLLKLTLTPGAGWAAPRLNIAWTYADAQAQAQTKYQVFIKNDSDGSTFYDSGVVVSAAAALVVPTTLVENSKYRIKVNVFDGLEWSGYSTELTGRARWGLTTHKKDMSVSGSAPTAWQVTSLGTTTGASSSVVMEYNSADDSSGTNLAATWAASLDTLTKRKFVHYRAWLLAWGTSPATSPSLDDITIQTSGLTAVPDYWSPSPISGQGGSIELASHAFGSQSLRMDGNNTSRVIYQSIPLDPNTDYVLQARIRSIGNSGAKVVLSDATSGASPLLATTAITADTDWGNPLTGGTYFNSGARSSIYVCCIITGATGTSGLFDGIKVERGRVTSPWSPGFVGDPVVIDAGGLQVDASAAGVFRLRGSTGGTEDVVGLGSNGLVIGSQNAKINAAIRVAKRLMYR